MEVMLTPGAIGKIISGEVTSEKEMVPVLQVAELKLIQSKIPQGQEPMKERFRMTLSDGTHLQQGMLGTTQNGLVKEGILQAGSIVRLTQFICNVIQDRRIVIVVQLEVISTNCQTIGHPVPGRKPGVVDSGNKSTTAGFEQHGRIESSGSRQMNNTETGRNHAAISPQVGQQRQVYGNTGSSSPGSAASSTTRAKLPGVDSGNKSDTTCFEQQGWRNHAAISPETSESNLVPEKQNGDGEDLNQTVSKGLKAFRERLSSAKNFIRDTRTLKDQIRATIRCFNKCIDSFNHVSEELSGMGFIEVVVRPSADDSEELSRDQLRSNAHTLLKFFRKKTLKSFVKAFSPFLTAESESDDTKKVLLAIRDVVDECDTLVYRVMHEGFDCRSISEDGEWLW